MTVRGFARCANPRIASSWTRRVRYQARARNYNTAGHVPAEATSAPSPFPIIGGLTSELDKIAPRFEIQSSQVQIIQSPSDFYETLKTKISNAKRRIYLATLYIGKTEHELIATIRDALRKNKELRVSFLTDALRGTREAPNPTTASLLAPLIAEFGTERVEVRMFHTPNLVGLRKQMIPKRINEGWGLQHMKLYGVDDELMLSGANLSNDYFTNRQDRYHVFSSASITDYFEGIYRAISNLSFAIHPANNEAGYTMSWPASNGCPSPLDDPSRFRSHAATLLKPLLRPPPSTQPLSPPSPSSTYIYPVSQFTPLLKEAGDTSTELPALTHILTSLSHPSLRGSKWTFTAGYFNMTPSIRQLLLSSMPSLATVICASPQANGFYLSKGVSGMLPPAYTYLAGQFLRAVQSGGPSSSITLKEWRRGTVNKPGGWSYHAKGIWVTPPGESEKGPAVSLVGSSNYTKRSYGLDLEANVLIVTGDEGLRKRLGEEERWLQEYARPVGLEDLARPERRVRWYVRAAMAITSLLGGAL